MKFLVHENFPFFALQLIRQYEAWKSSPHEILDVATEYGSGAPMDDWLDCAGKQGATHRPTVILVDDGIKTNAVSRQSMRESRCSFIVFARAWASEPWNRFAWKLLKAWPDITEMAMTAKEKGRQCRIDVTTNGKLHVGNL